MNRNTVYYIVICLLFIGLKFWFKSFDNDELNFLLKPTSWLFGIISGEQSIYSIETGYYYQNLNIVINKTCSGYNYLVLCFVMISFQIASYLKTIKFKILSVLVCFTVSYILTVLINTSRILISVLVLRINHNLINLYHKVVHEWVGIITYLSFLIIIYCFIEKIKKRYYA